MYEVDYKLFSSRKCPVALSVLSAHGEFISLVMASRRFPCRYPEGKSVVRNCCSIFPLHDWRRNEESEVRIEERRYVVVTADT